MIVKGSLFDTRDKLNVINSYKKQSLHMKFRTQTLQSYDFFVFLFICLELRLCRVLNYDFLFLIKLIYFMKSERAVVD